MQSPDPLIEQLRRCRHDPPRAAKLLYAYQDRLCSLVRCRLDPRVRARVDESDVVQETFVQALDRLDRYLDDASIPPFVWLRLIAAERVLQLHRHHLDAQKRDARVEVSIDGQASRASSPGALAEQLLSTSTTGSEVLDRDELHDTLTRLFEKLGDRDREMLELRHFERLTNKEAAQVLGVGANAAASRYYRALKRLRAAADDAGVSL